MVVAILSIRVCQPIDAHVVYIHVPRCRIGNAGISRGTGGVGAAGAAGGAACSIGAGSRAGTGGDPGASGPIHNTKTRRFPAMAIPGRNGAWLNLLSIPPWFPRLP